MEHRVNIYSKHDDDKSYRFSQILKNKTETELKVLCELSDLDAIEDAEKVFADSLFIIIVVSPNSVDTAAEILSMKKTNSVFVTIGKEDISDSLAFGQIIHFQQNSDWSITDNDNWNNLFVQIKSSMDQCHVVDIDQIYGGQGSDAMVTEPYDDASDVSLDSQRNNVVQMVMDEHEMGDNESIQTIDATYKTQIKISNELKNIDNDDSDCDGKGECGVKEKERVGDNKRDELDCSISIQTNILRPIDSSRSNNGDHILTENEKEAREKTENNIMIIEEPNEKCEDFVSCEVEPVEESNQLEDDSDRGNTSPGCQTIPITEDTKPSNTKNNHQSDKGNIIDDLINFILCRIVEMNLFICKHCNFYGEKDCVCPPSGLRNTLETCYMNSMIQALASSERLATTLVQCSKSEPKNVKMRMLVDTLRAINGSRGTTKCTESLRTFMNAVQWNRSSQQDAFQLLSFCINSIQKDNKNKEVFSPKFKILHAFSEDARYNKVQDHLALALPLCGSFSEKPGVSITSLFDAFFEPSLIDDGPNTTTMYLSEIVPDVMIVHIQANEWSNDKGAYIKPTYFIIYEEILEYTFKVYKEGDKSKLENIDAKYRLMAVVRHMGDVSGGHYITYRRCGQDWYLTNDEQVEKVDFDKNIVPYIMVYEKINDRNRGMDSLSV